MEEMKKEEKVLLQYDTNSLSTNCKPQIVKLCKIAFSFFSQIASRHLLVLLMKLCLIYDAMNILHDFNPQLNQLERLYEIKFSKTAIFF